MTKNELNESVIRIFSSIPYNNFLVNASSIAGILNWKYTKSAIKNAIIQLHNEQSLILNNGFEIFYDKSSKVKFDFIFDIHKN